MKQSKDSSISEYSLDIIKAAIKVYNAKSPEEIEIKRDLENLVHIIKKKDKEAAIECNKAITTKYPQIQKISLHYSLVPMKESELIQYSLEYQLIVLHQLAHCLSDKLKGETIKTKIGTIVKELAQTGLVYGIKTTLKKD